MSQCYQKNPSKLPMFPAHRNQFNNLLYNSPNWFLYNTNIGYYFVKENINSMFIKGEVFKNGSRKICKRQPLPMFKQPTHLKKHLSLILFGLFSNTLSYIESGGIFCNICKVYVDFKLNC